MVYLRTLLDSLDYIGSALGFFSVNDSGILTFSTIFLVIDSLEESPPSENSTLRTWQQIYN